MAGPVLRDEEEMGASTVDHSLYSPCMRINSGTSGGSLPPPAHAGSVAFVVDTGEAWPAEGSTVIDLAAAGGPRVVRRGLGDPSPGVDE